MGNSQPKINISMVGLAGAGKKSLLFNLRLGEVITTIPMIGFNVQTVEHKNIALKLWDVGDDEASRFLWPHFYAHTTLLIFVVDSNDVDRIGSAREELQKLLAEDGLRVADLLVFANKQDLPFAMSVDEVADQLALHNLKGRRWGIQRAVGKMMEGIYEGLDWAQRLQACPAAYQGPLVPSESLGVLSEPGFVITSQRVLVLAEPGTRCASAGINRKGSLEPETHLDVLELCLPDGGHALTYGRIEEPIAGWISLHSSHVRAQMFVVALHCKELDTMQGGIGISCCSMAGEEIAFFQLDAAQLKIHTVATLREQLGKLVRKDITCLKLVCATGKLLDPTLDAKLFADALRDSNDKGEQTSKLNALSQCRVS